MDWPESAPLETHESSARIVDLGAPVGFGQRGVPRLRDAGLDGAHVVLRFADGPRVRVPSLWLRDHCPEPASTHPVTGQREVDTFALPREPLVAALELRDAGASLVVRWADEPLVSRFSAATLADVLLPSPPSARASWDATHAVARFAWAEVVEDDGALLHLLESLERHGLATLHGIPTDVAATRRLLERVAYVRRTLFGDVWDFSADLAHADTAYTSVAIGPHTDGTYSHDPPGLQLLTCLEFDGTGGENAFVDGLRLSEDLAAREPDLHALLREVEIPARYLGDGVHLRARHPVLRFEGARLVQVAFNTTDRAPFFLGAEAHARLYEALRAFHAAAHDRRNQLRLTMGPGDGVWFDNWRVLHAREGYTGRRRLSGGYTNREDFESRLAVLREAVGCAARDDPSSSATARA